MTNPQLVSLSCFSVAGFANDHAKPKGKKSREINQTMYLFALKDIYPAFPGFFLAKALRRFELIYSTMQQNVETAFLPAEELEKQFLHTTSVLLSGATRSKPYLEPRRKHRPT